jgi:hypothetical protein
MARGCVIVRCLAKNGLIIKIYKNDNAGPTRSRLTMKECEYTNAYFTQKYNLDLSTHEKAIMKIDNVYVILYYY